GALAESSPILANYLLTFLRLSPERSPKGTPQWNQEHPTRRSPSDAAPHGAERSKTLSSSLTTVTAPWGARSSTCRLREPSSCPPTFFSVPRNSCSSLRLANPAIVRSCGAGARRLGSTTFDEHANRSRRLQLTPQPLVSPLHVEQTVVSLSAGFGLYPLP